MSEHPHGLSDSDFDSLFTRDKPVIFAFHAYPWLIHRLTYRRHNHDNLHVRGYKEEGTITTAFDMTVLNDLDRFHLVIDAIDRLPQIGSEGAYLKQQLNDKLVEHQQYIDRYGEDMPEIRNWLWPDEGHSAGPLSGQFRCAVRLSYKPFRGKPTANAGKRRQHRFPKGCAPMNSQIAAPAARRKPCASDAASRIATRKIAPGHRVALPERSDLGRQRREFLAVLRGF